VHVAVNDVDPQLFDMNSVGNSVIIQPFEQKMTKVGTAANVA
jgi:hypothetical protein